MATFAGIKTVVGPDGRGHDRRRGAGAPDVEVVAEVSDGLAAERAARALRAAIAAQDGACSPEAATGPSIADSPAARP